eukprot:4286429-Pyramimonas_sp.AAC.1
MLRGKCSSGRSGRRGGEHDVDTDAQPRVRRSGCALLAGAPTKRPLHRLLFTNKHAKVGEQTRCMQLTNALEWVCAHRTGGGCIWCSSIGQEGDHG